MKARILGTGLAIMLLMPAGAFAQQGQQTTDDQKSFKNNVEAQPTTKKREEIIRSESDQPTGKADKTDKNTVGTGSRGGH
jgi:hypothetical protein